jgi:hypothetical protein
MASAAMHEVLTLAFGLGGFHGRVRVLAAVNEDPARWGYELLGVDQAIVKAARGHPVVQATVEFPAEGYAAEFGWVQVVSHTTANKSTRVICDVPPQMADSGMPFMSFGTRPTFFDAPADTVLSSRFRATAFLTYSPDVLMTKVVAPICGFRWGFDKVAGEPRSIPTERAEAAHWERMANQLRSLYPTWDFRAANRAEP